MSGNVRRRLTSEPFVDELFEGYAGFRLGLCMQYGPAGIFLLVRCALAMGMRGRQDFTAAVAVLPIPFSPCWEMSLNSAKIVALSCE